MRGIYAWTIAGIFIVGTLQALGANPGNANSARRQSGLVSDIKRVVGNHQESGELQKFLGADFSKNVIVDFGATWCPHCVNMKPVIAGLKANYIVYEVDVDKQKLLAREQRVHSLPTFIIYNNGEEVKRLVGEQSVDALTAGVKTKKDQDPNAVVTPVSPVTPDYHFTQKH